jgi:hypothetical protein
MPTPQDFEAQDDAFVKQYDEQQAAKQQQEAQAKQPPSFPARYMTNVGRMSVQQLDAAVADEPAAKGTPLGSFADAVSDPIINDSPGMRTARSATAGAMTGATNMVDAGLSAMGSDYAGAFNNYLAKEAAPIWAHAKSTILDFRDAVQVQDPTLANELTQSAGQLVPGFVGASKALEGLNFAVRLADPGKLVKLAGGAAQMYGAGAADDATALGPHDARLADTLAMLQHTEGRLGDTLRKLGPYGLNSYINYLTDNHPGEDPAARSQHETEAQGRWKNVLDGMGANTLVTPLVHAVGITLKAGWTAVRSAVEAGLQSPTDLFKMGPAAGSPAAQRGSVGVPTEPSPTEAAAPQKLPVIAQKLSDTPPEGSDAIGKALRYVDATTRFARPQPLQKVIGQLASGLDESTPDGAFYKQLFSDLGQHDIKTMLVSAEHLGVADRPTLRGHYNRAADMMAIPPAGMQRDTFLHTLGHESVHAVTMHAVNDSEIVANALSGLANEARIHPEFQSLALQDKYALLPRKNPRIAANELVAEAHANPRFQQVMRKAKTENGRSFWDEYKDIVAHIVAPGGAAAAVLSANPTFDKLLTAEEKPGA